MKIILKCNRFIELLGCKNLFFIFNILPPGFFFENRTFKWVALIGFWIKFILFLHFAPNETTRVGNSLVRSSLFCSKLLILKSDCEQFAQIAHEKKSNCEQIAQVTHQKRATVSDLLRATVSERSLRTKEQPGRIICFFWVNGSFPYKKWVIH